MNLKLRWTKGLDLGIVVEEPGDGKWVQVDRGSERLGVYLFSGFGGEQVLNVTVSILWEGAHLLVTHSKLLHPIRSCGLEVDSSNLSLDSLDEGLALLLERLNG